MAKLEIRFVKEEGAKVPKYSTASSSGLDLFAFIKDSIVIEPKKWALIPTGIRLSIPRGYEGEIRPRSGLAMKYGVTVLNSPGTIDADYRGEIKVILINLGDQPFQVEPGMRIAQLVIRKIEEVELVEDENLPLTERGEGGFGSTGIK